LLVQLLGVTPARASFLLIFVNFAGLFGRIGLSYLSDAIGRKATGAIASFGAAILIVSAALSHNVFFGSVSVFWLLLIVNNAFADGGFAIVGPYSAEVWPVALRTTGMGSAYGFGGLGKVIGPLGLALIVGSSNIITPKASVAALLPAFSYLAGWFALAGLAYIFVGMETKGRSLETIEKDLDASRPTQLESEKAESRRV
jgi:putative MFS transporter